MAVVKQIERYTAAVIDVNDMTITEMVDDCIQTHSITDICKRWHGIPGIQITISVESPVLNVCGEVSCR